MHKGGQGQHAEHDWSAVSPAGRMSIMGRPLISFLGRGAGHAAKCACRLLAAFHVVVSWFACSHQHHCFSVSFLEFSSFFQH